jgi:hypothetical protein
MATFRKNKKPLRIPKRKTSVRKIVSSSKSTVQAKAESVSKPKQAKEPAIQETPKVLPKVEKLPIQPKEDSPIRSVLSESGDNEMIEEAEVQIQEIDRMIANASKRLEELAIAGEETVMVKDEPISYDGVSSEAEHLQLLHEELKNSQRKSMKMAHEIDLLKAEFDHEKTELEKTVRELRKELHRTAPIQDNKFFSLSKDLRDAVSAIEELTHKPQDVTVDLEEVAAEPVKTVEVMEEEKPPAALASEEEGDHESKKRIVQRNTENEELPKKTVKKEAEAEKPKKAGSKKKKLLITGGVAVVLILILSGVITTQFMGEAKVDQSLVEEYLQAGGGTVAGVQSAAGDGEGGTIAPQVDPAQAEVSIDATIWESYSDSTLGVQLQYPINASRVTKTDSNATFERKTGFIFRVQRVETDLKIKEYWEQIQATNLDYAVTETTFSGRDALHLKLEDEADFPGDRYLVKSGEVIFDVWYATPSDKFDADDIKRVQQMLNTLSFISD